ncbi:hypothetical protein [Kitasatospora sp. NPDC097691]|uniref:hypothetical protein n=1 Tax=Kitasatospora sp. NPDC097691 TaxID=3157231 RepID=UPI0033171E00
MEETGNEPELAHKLREALGHVVQAAANVESDLRTVTAALLETKYGAVVVAGQSANWLIETIQALIKVHDRVDDQKRDELKGVLTRIKQAFEERNRLAHGVWGTGVDGAIMSHTSKLRRIDWQQSPVTLDSMNTTASELLNLSSGLYAWMFGTLPPEAITTEAQLRWEAYVRSLSPEELATLAERRQHGTT